MNKPDLKEKDATYKRLIDILKYCHKQSAKYEFEKDDEHLNLVFYNVYETKTDEFKIKIMSEEIKNINAFNDFKHMNYVFDLVNLDYKKCYNDVIKKYFELKMPEEKSSIELLDKMINVIDDIYYNIIIVKIPNQNIRLQTMLNTLSGIAQEQNDIKEEIINAEN